MSMVGSGNSDKVAEFIYTYTYMIYRSVVNAVQSHDEEKVQNIM